MLGVKDDKAVHLTAAGHGTHSLKDFVFILACDDRVDILAVIAELADSPDSFQIERILISVPGRGGKDDAYGPGVLGGKVTGLEIGLITKLCHGAAYPFLGLVADGGIVFAGSGNCGGGYACQSSHLLDGNSHNNAPFCGGPFHVSGAVHSTIGCRICFLSYVFCMSLHVILSEFPANVNCCIKRNAKSGKHCMKLW